jgi:hypothetical protein
MKMKSMLAKKTNGGVPWSLPLLSSISLLANRIRVSSESNNQTSVGTLLISGGVMTESVYSQAPLI